MSAFVLSSKRHTHLLVLTPPILPLSAAEWLSLEKTRPVRIAPSAAALRGYSSLSWAHVTPFRQRELTDKDADEGMNNITQKAMNYQIGITGLWRAVKNFDIPQL